MGCIGSGTGRTSDVARGGGMPRRRMPLQDRAKIFSPFDPLDGFREALRQKELEVERDAELGGALGPSSEG